jgi:hypothetical protein
MSYQNIIVETKGRVAVRGGDKSTFGKVVCM